MRRRSPSSSNEASETGSKGQVDISSFSAAITAKAEITVSKNLQEAAGRAGRAIDAISDGSAMVAGSLVILCAIAITYEIVARYVFNAPTKWESEIVVDLAIWFSLLSISYALKEGAHVRIELVLARLSDSNRRILEALSYVFILAYCAIFTRWSISLVLLALKTGETSQVLSIPLWPTKLALLVGMILLGLQTIRMLSTRFHSVMKERLISRGSQPILTLVAFCAVFILGVVVINFNPLVGLLIMLFMMLLAGIPVGFTLGLVGCMGLFFVFGGEKALISVPSIAYWQLDSFTLTALPLFMFVAIIMQKAGLGEQLFDFASAWIGHIPGGLAVATLISCAVFAAISGSSAANAATIGLVAVPALVARNYDRRLTCGLVAAGGTIGVLIPPSNQMIIYGVLVEESIGKLFMAGLIPGILLTILLSITAVIFVERTKKYERAPAASWSTRLVATKSAFPVLMLPIIVVGGLYTGVFTPTEAAGVAVVYVGLYMVFARKASWRELVGIIGEGARVIGMVVMVIVGATTLAKVIVMLRIAQNLATALTALNLPGWLFIAAIMVLLIILGMFLEAISINMILVPIIAPVLSMMGYNLIWFAVLMTVNLEIGCITPPVGVNLYVLQQIGKVPLEDVVIGALPFMAVFVLFLIFIALVPEVSLWLPSLMR